jgi:G3E family GTPase
MRPVATEIYIISGFLGAGKTTLIQKLLREAFAQEKVALIENDFGEISVDAALLKSSGVEIREISAGCICCSLSGDFVSALKDLLKRYQPDKIIIEPSGVGKLSDIVTACADPQIQSLAKVKSRITVADAKRCKMYLENFGEFFINQIENADVILLNRTGLSPNQAAPARRLVKKLNPHARLFSEPWEQIAAGEILAPHPREAHCGHDHHCSHSHEHSHAEPICCDHYSHDHHSHAELACSDHHDHHDHHEHHGACGCGHNHAAEEIFDTVTIRTKRRFRTEDLLSLVSRMEQSAKGSILRAKGIVQGTGGYLNFQYLPGDVQITNSAVGGDMLCFIGRHLNQQELTALFGAE